LEHVEDDEGFVRMVADLLAPDGIAIFTVDFSNSYPADARKPAIDRRLYNTRDLRDRLMAIMPDCCLVDVPSWNDGSSDFEYDGCNYAFASWVFRKLNIRRVLNSEANGSATHWKVQSAAQSAEIERLQKLIAAQSAEIERLQKLSQELVQNLRWPDGPPALRRALRLARLFRRVVRKFVRPPNSQ
jgi:hypothetical protein